VNAIRIETGTPAKPGERKGKGMRIQFILNHKGTPSGKLADVEILFEEGFLAGLKLGGCSIWRPLKGDAPTVLVTSRSYATAGGVRYYQFLRSSEDGEKENQTALKTFKQYIRDEYRKIVPPDPGMGTIAR
jgi:hypothetical protein